MALIMRKLVKSCNITAFFTSFVIVATFIYLRDKAFAIDHSEQLPDAARHMYESNYKAPGRTLLKYTFHRRKKLPDTLWKTKLKFKSWRQLSYKQLQNPEAETFTGTTPLVTDTATNPKTVHSETTPMHTNSPTPPITTESITTPIVTEPGEKEVTTDQEKVLLR